MALEGVVQNLATIVTTLQANMKEVKDIMTKLVVDPNHLLEDPKESHEGQTMDKSI